METQMLSRLFGPTDRDLAKKYGYFIKIDPPPPGLPGEADPNFFFVLLGVKDPDDWIITTGVAATESPGTIDGIEIPPGGCTSDAERRLGGVSEYPTSYARDLLILNSLEAPALPEYQTVVNEWVECMADKGYSVSGLTTQPGDDDWEFKLRDPLTSPSDEEVTMVLADIDCKEQTRLHNRLQKILQELDKKSVEKHQLALQEDRARIEESVRLATAEIEKMGGFE
ncbi:MAG: hypothetical protein QM713_04055 [Arachnia sp.]